MRSALSEFANVWASVEVSMHIRNCGAAIFGVGAFIVVLLPFIPKAS